MPIPLREVKGLGPKTESYLEMQGITTVEELCMADNTVLMAAPRMSDSRAREIMAYARALQGENKKSVTTDNTLVEGSEDTVNPQGQKEENGAGVAATSNEKENDASLFMIVLAVLAGILIASATQPPEEEYYFGLYIFAGVAAGFFAGLIDERLFTIPFLIAITVSIYQYNAQEESWYGKPWALVTAPFLSDDSQVQNELLHEQALLYKTLKKETILIKR